MMQDKQVEISYSGIGLHIKPIPEIKKPEWTQTKQVIYALLVHQNDPEREYTCDAVAEQALKQALTEGWMVASMKDHW